MLKFIKKHIPLTLAYLGLTIIFTYPQILHMASGCVEPPIGGSNDQYLHMWDAWWVKKALFDLKASPYYTHLLNYPQGASLALQEIGVLNGILTAPFQMVIDKPHGLIFGYNVGIILSFLISALGMYALALDISRDRATAFIAGIGFAFMPYRATYITTLNLLSTGWIPLYVLFFFRTIRAPSARNIVWSAVFFAFTLHSSFMYAFFLMLFSVVFVLAHLLVDYKTVLNKRVLRGLALLSGFCLIILLPNLIMIFLADISWTQPIEVSDLFSANVAGYFFPSDQQIIFRFLFSILPPFQYYVSGVPGHATFVSFTLLVLFFYGIIKASKREIMPWLITFVVFLVLSLGSRLHVWSWETDVKLPYLLLIKYLPFSSAMRTPVRFVVLERIALIVVAAFGMKVLFLGSDRNSVVNGTEPKAKAWRRRVLLPGALAVLLIAELLHVPFKYVEANVPKIYFEISKAEEEFAVVDLPVSRYRDLAKYMFYQTVHEKPISLGIINRPEARLEETTGDIISILRKTRRLDAELLEILRRYGAGFAIWHNFQDGKDDVVVHKLL